MILSTLDLPPLTIERNFTMNITSKHFNPLTVTIVLCLCVTLTGCGDGDDPAKVVEQFLTAVQKNDRKATEQYATPQSMGVLDTPLFGDILRNRFSTPAKVDKSTLTIDGDTATVRAVYGNKDDFSDFTLKKMDGKWKVDIKM